MRILAIDPGRDMGWALFSEGKLTHCGLVHDPKGIGQSADLLVIERPQHYPGGVKCDPNDLITLAVLVGRTIEVINAPKLLLVHPRKWKGTTPKEIVKRRVEDTLTGDQKNAFLQGVKHVAKGQVHNVVEAVGIGLWFLTMGPKVG